MKKTQFVSLYPMQKGLDKNSVPGTQEPRSLIEAKNIIINNRGSLKKRPGVRRLDYAGDDSKNLQGGIQFFATSGGSQRSEVIRVIGGRMEALRDGIFVDLGISVNDTDAVVFSRFANALIVHFENTRPQKYLIGGTPTNLNILTGHDVSPPTFSRVHDFRLWYGGRSAQPHRLTVSAIDDIENYALTAGGFQIKINEGDGDPVGLTGISQTFRGDLFAFKFNSIYRIFRAPYGYGVDQFTDEIGCVNHNTIVNTQNDVFFVSSDGIHSLANTEKFGAIEEATLTYPIYDFFQEDINWSLSKNMVMTYDKPSNCLLLSYTSSGSSMNDKILGFNQRTKEFFVWEDAEYPIVGKYFDLFTNRQKTLIGDSSKGMGILDEAELTDFDRAIESSFMTGVIFPLQSPKAQVNFTQAWLLARPTTESTTVKFGYFIDGNKIDTVELDTQTKGATFEGTSSGVIGTSIIGTGLIGKERDQMAVIGVDLKGTGNSVQFEVSQTPSANDSSKEFEVYGIIFEFDYYEDTGDKVLT